jgi:hypothetical protein
VRTDDACIVLTLPRPRIPATINVVIFNPVRIVNLLEFCDRDTAGSLCEGF